MRILGPLLVGGAVAAGALVLSLFIEPRAADEGAVAHDAALLDVGGPSAERATVPMMRLVPAIRRPAIDATLARRVATSFFVAPAQLVSSRSGRAVAGTAESVSAFGDLALACRAIDRFDLVGTTPERLAAVVRGRRALQRANAARPASDPIDEDPLLDALTEIAGERADEVAAWIDASFGV